MHHAIGPITLILNYGPFQCLLQCIFGTTSLEVIQDIHTRLVQIIMCLMNLMFCRHYSISSSNTYRI